MSEKIVTRAQWGAAKARPRSPIGVVKGLAIHYTAAESDRQPLHRNCAARVRAIQRFHMSADPNDPTKPWADIAYSFLVCQHGYTFVGRGWGVRTAAQGTNDGNDGYHAACFLGRDATGRDDVTVLGREALTRIVLNSRLRYPNGRELRPHSFFRSTSCPGTELRLFIDHLNRALNRP